MKKIFFSTLLLSLTLGFSTSVLAAPLTLTPGIIDLKGKPRELIHTEVTIKNSSQTTRYTLYGFDQNLGSGGVALPKDKSLTEWIRYNRSLEVARAEDTILPIAVDVHPDARPGVYHALLTLVPANSRFEAETMLKSGLQIAVNFEVVDDSRELIELRSFRTEEAISGTPPFFFITELANSGNRPSSISGSIRITDRRGKEVAAVTVAPFTMGAAATTVLKSSWQNSLPLGRYKAYLDLHYGVGEIKTVTDSTFFLVMRVRQVLALFVIGLTGVCLIVYLLHLLTKRNEPLLEDHR